MRTKSFAVDVHPKVLQWARLSIGYSVDELAKKMGEAPETITSWEAGSDSITYSKLKIFAQKTHRSTTSLLLDSPPKEDDFPTDFRLHENSKKHDRYDKLILAIRSTREHQLAFVDLIDDQEQSLFQNLPKLKLNENPEQAAMRVRDLLNVSFKTQEEKWKDRQQAYEKWIEILESFNILVFQEPWKEEYGRAFSLYHPSAPAIVINSNDAINAKIFSLMHEFGHILLHKVGICNPGLVEDSINYSPVAQKTKKVEIFCNHFSGALLVPKEPLVTYHRTKYLKGHTEIDDDRLERIATDFKVSKEVILRRLLIADKVSQTWYKSMRETWKQRPEKRPQGGGKGGRNMPKECLNHNGLKYSNAVIQAYHRDIIPLSEASNLLNLKVKYFEKFEKIATGEK